MKTSDELRAVAEEHQQAAQTLRRKLGASHENLVGVIVASVSAKMYAGLADVLDMLMVDQQGPPSGAAEAARRLVARNQEMRKAILSGNWERFSQLVGGDADSEPDAAGAGA